MRRLPLSPALGLALFVGSAAAPVPASAGPQIHPAVAISVRADTTLAVPFDVPAQPVPEALQAFSLQATIRVEVDRSAAGALNSVAVTGTLTPPEALRRMLAGTGLAFRFLDDASAIVTRVGEEELPVYALSPLVVIGERSRGYVTSRTMSATKTDLPLRDAPQALTVIPARLMADQAMQGMTEVLRYVPGVTMGQGEGHRDAPTIRGNSSTADFFVDGLRDDAQYLRDLYNVERVEALKGANAMIFGRGGGGGVVNRVAREAQWTPTRSLTLEGGSFDHQRGTLDVGQGFGPTVAARLNAVYDDSESFRSGFELQRWGVNPTVAVALGARTIARAGWERFVDERTVDRGIPSFQGRPSDADRTTFFGNPGVSRSELDLHSVSAGVEHLRSAVTIRSRIRFTDYDKFYRNSFAGGAVTATGTQVALSAYSNRSDRVNLFGVTDVVVKAATGAVDHTVLAGVEAGRQRSDNYRETGYYDGNAASLLVAFDQPTVATPIEFRQSATDADAEATATVAGVYVQDQLGFGFAGTRVQLTLGARLDRFGLDFTNRRAAQSLERSDDLLSPRAALVLKPTAMASLYGAYSVSYLPSSGDQFSSLTPTSATLDPERFTSREVGAKWDALQDLSLTAAAYQLDRTNTSAPDPADPSRVLQTGEQRTRGVELGVSGSVTEAWQVAGGVTWQEAEVISRTSAAPAGARVPLVPSRTASLWNRVQIVPQLGVGLGVLHQADMFAAIDNTVTLPGFTRVDGALFVRLGEGLGLQLNVENLFDESYFATSHGNNNIMPGAARTVRVSLSAGR